MLLVPSLALLLVLQGGSPSSLEAAPPKPNVVVLMLDTLRPDHLGFFGYPKPTSPFMDSLAAESAVFLEARSTTSWTAPACASLFTGHYPPAHGVLEGFFAHRRRADRVEDESPEILVLNRIPEDMKALPEYFQDAGYRTYCLATNLNIGPEIGFDRGFDHFVCLDDATADVVAQELEKWREEVASSDQPYFLYLHLMDAHMPYHAREPLYEAHENETDDARSRYDSEILFMDGWLEKIFTRWGWGPETLLVALSDHGEEFGEHGEIGHRHSLHVELNRILLMFRGPGVRPGKIPYLGGIHDVLPTLLDLASLPPPDEGTGLNLGPLLRGIASKDEELEFRDRTLFAHRAKFRPKTSHLWAANYKGFRMIQDAGVDLFFDLTRDPLEELNRVSMLPILSQDVRSKLWDFRRMGFGDRSTPIEIEIDLDTLSLLDALGYVDSEEDAGEGEPGLDGQPEGP